MKRKLIYILIAIIFTNQSFGQDISGTWVGNYGRAFLTPAPQKLVIEIFTFNDSIITGASHLYYRSNKYEHYKIKGIFHKKDSTVTFKEDSTLAVKLGFLEDNCLGMYYMKLYINDTALRLVGKWKDVSRSLFHCPTSSVWLEKRIKKQDSFIKGTSLLNPLPGGTVDLNRSSDIQSLVEIRKAEKDSIKIEIYDNGEIDNDSVSVYFNDSLIVSRRMISLKPILIYVNAGEFSNLNKIKLVAISLGSIPPCTALMIITTKTKRYEVNLSSSYYKNGIVELFVKD